MRHHRVRIMWQNVTMALIFAVLTAVACLLIVQHAGAAKAYLLVVAIAAGAFLIVRTLRTGVYARPQGLTIRHTWRTRTIPWQSITAVGLYEGRSGRGGAYYAPTVMVQDGQTSQVNLWMLAALSRTSARRMQDRIARLSA